MTETSVVNPEFVGRTYPPSGPYAVSAAQIAAVRAGGCAPLAGSVDGTVGA